MKAKDWQNAAKLIRERQSTQPQQIQASSVASLSVNYQLTRVDHLLCYRVHMSHYQQTMDSAQDESPFQQVIPNIPQQSLYPSLVVLETSLNTSVSPPIPFSRRVINDIKEQERKALKDMVEGTVRWTNTSPTSDLEE